METSWHLLYICEARDCLRREFVYCSENPKKGPDIKIISDMASYLGIMDLVMEKIDIEMIERNQTSVINSLELAAEAYSV